MLTSHRTRGQTAAGALLALPRGVSIRIAPPRPRRHLRAAIPLLLLTACIRGAGWSEQPPLLRGTVESYVTKHVGLSDSAGPVLCSTALLGVQGHPPAHVYVWAVCREYHDHNGYPERGASVSTPVALDLHMTDSVVYVTAMRTPRAGPGHDEDVHRLFPLVARLRMRQCCEGKTSSTALRLVEEHIAMQRDALFPRERAGAVVDTGGT